MLAQITNVKKMCTRDSARPQLLGNKLYRSKKGEYFLDFFVFVFLPHGKILITPAMYCKLRDFMWPRILPNYAGYSIQFAVLISQELVVYSAFLVMRFNVCMLYMC